MQVAVEGLLTSFYLADFLMQFRTTCLGNGTTAHSGLDLPTSVNNGDGSPTGRHTGQLHLGNFSTVAFLSGCVQLIVKAGWDTYIVEINIQNLPL